MLRVAAAQLIYYLFERTGTVHFSKKTIGNNRKWASSISLPTGPPPLYMKNCPSWRVDSQMLPKLFRVQMINLLRKNLSRKKSLLFKGIFKMGHSRSLSLFSSFIQLYNFSNFWIWTADLWCRMQPLYQLSRNHCPFLALLFRRRVIKPKLLDGHSWRVKSTCVEWLRIFRN